MIPLLQKKPLLRPHPWVTEYQSVIDKCNSIASADDRNGHIYQLTMVYWEDPESFCDWLQMSPPKGWTVLPITLTKKPDDLPNASNMLASGLCSAIKRVHAKKHFLWQEIIRIINGVRERYLNSATLLHQASKSCDGPNKSDFKNIASGLGGKFLIVVVNTHFLFHDKGLSKEIVSWFNDFVVNTNNVVLLLSNTPYSHWYPGNMASGVSRVEVITKDLCNHAWDDWVTEYVNNHLHPDQMHHLRACFRERMEPFVLKKALRRINNKTDISSIDAILNGIREEVGNEILDGLLPCCQTIVKARLSNTTLTDDDREQEVLCRQALEVAGIWQSLPASVLPRKACVGSGTWQSLPATVSPLESR
ncbi:MAG: hypothetical protein HQM06_11245 [Magnetococcales bacterium]|nr:hypothetical protein [Magnetococcales bacterium]